MTAGQAAGKRSGHERTAVCVATEPGQDTVWPVDIVHEVDVMPEAGAWSGEWNGLSLLRAPRLVAVRDCAPWNAIVSS
jgi:hypothetical protein